MQMIERPQYACFFLEIRGRQYRSHQLLLLPGAIFSGSSCQPTLLITDITKHIASRSTFSPLPHLIARCSSILLDGCSTTSYLSTVDATIVLLHFLIQLLPHFIYSSLGNSHKYNTSTTKATGLPSGICLGLFRLTKTRRHTLIRASLALRPPSH